MSNEDRLNNFGMIIPTQPFSIEKKEKKVYTTIDELMVDAPFKYRWCDADLCACMGCVNNFIATNGFTREQWEEWVSRNPDPNPPQEGYSFTSFKYEKK